jgi:hypothetical protein
MGGDTVVVTGTKLGSQCGLNTLLLGGVSLAMTLCNAGTIVARVPPGAGTLGNLTLTVNGQPATVGGGAAWVFGYAPPTLARIEGDTVLPTVGVRSGGGTTLLPSNVTLVGANFGPSGTPLLVTFTSDVDGVVRTARNCTRDPVGHAWVSCFGVVGVGVGHRWAVSVSGQGSGPTAHTTSFAPPQALSVYGPGGHNANTDGGQVVLIDGLDFGPVSSLAPESNDALVAVVYGPADAPARYTAEGCRVVAASATSATLSCVTVPGTGGGLVWTVTVGNQTSADTVGPTAYGWPVIATFEGPAASAGVTQGFEVVVIYGSNFGACRSW